jgi:hypothetical protein
MAIQDVIFRMNRIFENLVGCKIEFQPADSLNSNLWKEHDLKRLRNKDVALPRFVSSTNEELVGFPVNLNGAFAGLAIVHGWVNSKPRRLILLAELLSLTLESGLQQEERRERLQLVEHRLKLLDENSNVLPFRQSGHGRILPLVDTTSVTAEPAPTSPLTTLPLLIETASGFPLNRVAIEIHNLSTRWALINIEDLPADIFDSREGVEQLGAMTIFIRDITLLSYRQQQRLLEYLALRPPGNQPIPHIIAGICEPIDEAILSGKLIAELTEIFSVSTLKWDNKTPDQVTADLINASLRQLLDQIQDSHQDDARLIPFHIKYFDPDQPTTH